MKLYYRRDYQRGQALLIVILVMVTVLTVGLSLATRTITNVRVTQEEENSERAFSAAEAGIERSVATNIEASGNFPNGTSYQTSVVKVAGVEFLMNNGASVLKDSAVDVWLTDYPAYSTSWNGNVTIYWGNSSDVCSADEFDNTAAALEIDVISGTKANPVNTKYAVDPCSSRASVNKFEYVPSNGGVIGEKTFARKKTIPVSSGLVIRVTPLYASTALGVNGCDAINSNCLSLPSQGSLVESVGKSDTTTRKVVSFVGYPQLPTEMFPFVLYSPK